MLLLLVHFSINIYQKTHDTKSCTNYAMTTGIMPSNYIIMLLVKVHPFSFVNVSTIYQCTNSISASSNESSAVAEMAAQCCTSHIFTVEWTYLSLKHFY